MIGGYGSGYEAGSVINDIANAIEYYQNRSVEEIKHHREIGLKIKEDYFEPVTKAGVLKFLGILKEIL